MIVIHDMISIFTRDNTQQIDNEQILDLMIRTINMGSKCIIYTHLSLDCKSMYISK